MDRDLLVTVLSIIGASGGALVYANAQRLRIRKEGEQLAAQTDEIQDKRIRDALSDAADAERRAHRWSDGFRRLYRWIQRHFDELHHDDGHELPGRDTFTEPD